MPTAATVAFPEGPSVAATPFTVAPAAMFEIGVEATPATAEPFAGTANALPLTFTDSVAVAQLAGVLRSHS